MQTQLNFLTAFCFAFCYVSLAQDPPSIPQLVERGSETVEKLSDTSASWTSVFELPNGAEARVEVLQSVTDWSKVISLAQGNEKTVLASIIERDGYWYVEQGKTSGKYLPFQAPLYWPAGYLYLAKSDPIVLTSEIADSIGNFRKWEGKNAVFAIEVSAQRKQQLQRFIDTTEMIMKEQEIPATVRESYERQKRLLKNGFELKVDSDLGLVIQNGSEGSRFWTREFRFASSNVDKKFTIDLKKWTDYTNEIAIPESRSKLIMAMHQPLWKPGQPGGDGNMVLMNIETGAMRRIPVQVAGGQGSLSTDSRFAYLSSMDIATGSMVVVQVDLKSGHNRPLGNPELQVGLCMFPVISPDGRSLAVLQNALGGQGIQGMLESQIHVIDIQTGSSRKVGIPLDTGPIAWLPDGKGLIVNRREMVDDKSKPSIGHVCRMSLDGIITPIIDGGPAIVLERSERILFCENGRKHWRTCDFNGSNVRDFGDGFTSFGFPAPNRDGSKVIMMKFDPKTGPKPHIVDVETATVTPIPVADGLWSNLSW